MYTDGIRDARCRRPRSPPSPRGRAPTRLPASTITTSSPACVRPGTARVTYQPVSVPIAGQPEHLRELMAFDVLFAAPPKDQRVFFGPKDFDVMAAIDRDLVRTINYGIFSILAVPLLHALKWINAFVGNYGWSIIILTVLINVAMFPLPPQERRVDAEDAGAAAADEGHPGSLREAEDDRSRAVEEAGRDHGALPREGRSTPRAGACRCWRRCRSCSRSTRCSRCRSSCGRQPWALWIHDLSQHDPYYITPVLMGISMLWQQRLTPRGRSRPGEDDDADADHVPSCSSCGRRAVSCFTGS